MKVYKYIEISQEVEIDLSSEDIKTIFDSDGDSLDDILRGLNGLACFLRGVSESKIAEMTQGQREVVGKFLSIEAERYNSPYSGR